MTNKLKFKKSLLAIGLASCTSFIQAQTPDAGALPQGGQVVSGQASISAQANLMDIHQTSQQAILNWQQFNIGSDATVNFNQPGVDAVALNRVIGADASAIYGNLNANGQVFLVNPNGVLFAPGSSVDVGGLVASSMNLSNQNFLDRNYLLEGGSASVVNAGNISADYAALLAPEVTNLGVINTRAGTTALAGGDTVRLNITGNSLIDIEVSQASIDTLVENRHLIQADGGQVIMSAQSINGFLGNVVNAGVIEAKGIVNDGGSVWLAASDSIDLGGSINADAAANGNGGSIIAIADLTNANSTTEISGTLSAQGGSQSGDGGFIETSASHLSFAESAGIDTSAANGQTGQWLLDPVDFTVAASGGDITGNALSTALGLNAVTIQTTDTTASCTPNPTPNCGAGDNTGNGDIFVNDAVAWDAATSLTLSAWRDVRINAPISVDNTGGGLALETGQSAASADFFPGGTYFVNAPVTLVEGAGFSVKDFNDVPAVNYTVINDATELADISADLDGFYVLGNDITAVDMASIGASWTPLGTSVGTPFEGVFDGLFNTIDGLTHSNAGSDTNVGLFGYVDIFNGPGLIQNVGLTNVNIAGSQNVGALVGYNNGLVFNSYAIGVVTGSGAGSVGAIGGLVGNSPGGIQQSYADVAVTATEGNQSGNPFTDTQGGIGGLAGIVGTAVADSYALGDVTGTNYVGGLAGYSGASINSSFAAGTVTLSPTGSTNVGGLIGGVDYGSGIPFVFSSFYDSTKNPGGGGGTVDDEVTGVSTANLQLASTFAAFDSVNIWELADGQYPRLKIGSDFLTTVIDLTISLDDLQRDYGETTQPSLSSFDYSGTLLDGDTLSLTWGTGLADTLGVGAYAYDTTADLITPVFTFAGSNSLSNYNITLPSTSLTITARPITVAAQAQSKEYNGQAGTDPAFLTPIVTSNLGTALVNGDSLSGSLVRAPGNDVTTYAISQGTLTAGSNYAITYESANFTITPKDLSITGGFSLTTPSRVYDGTVEAGEVQGTAVFSGLVAGENFTTTGLPASTSFADKNVGVGKQVIVNPNNIGLVAVGGSNPANYNLTSVSGITGDITPKDLSLTGLSINPRAYDGTTEVSLGDISGLPTALELHDSGCGIAGDAMGCAGDNVLLSYSGAAAVNYNDKDVLDANIVTLSGASLGGTDAANYNLLPITAAATMLPREISVALIDNPTTISKEYDGTTDANAGDLITRINFADMTTWGFVEGESALTPFTLAYAGSDVGTTDVTASYSGWAAQNANTVLSNYDLPTEQSFEIAEITPRAISVSGQTGVDRAYNTATAVEVSGGTLTGVLAGDAGLVEAGTGSGSTASPNAGQNLNVTINETPLTGDRAVNYVIDQFSTDATVNITQAQLTLVPVASVERVYDGTDYIVIPVLTQGVLEGDQGRVLASAGEGGFNDGVIVYGGSYSGNVFGSNAYGPIIEPELYGEAAANYFIGGLPWTEHPVAITITPKELDVLGLIVDSRSYNGTTNASLSGALSLRETVARGGGDSQDGRPFEDDLFAISLGTLTGQFGSANVGIQDVSLEGEFAIDSPELAASYSLRLPTGLTGNITPAPLTITADDQTKRQGSVFTFDGDEFSITGGQLFAQDNITALTLTSEGAAAGASPQNYDIIANNPQGSGLTNYQFTFVDGELTVPQSTLEDVLSVMMRAINKNQRTVMTNVFSDSSWTGRDAGSIFIRALYNSIGGDSEEFHIRLADTLSMNGGMLTRNDIVFIAAKIGNACGQTCDMSLVNEWWARGALAGNNTLAD